MEIEDKSATLEDRLTLNIVSEDHTLTKKLTAHFESSYDTHSSALNGFIERAVEKPMDVYLLDLLAMPTIDYKELGKKINFIKAIRPESKIIILTPTSESIKSTGVPQQAQETYIYGLSLLKKEINPADLADIAGGPYPQHLKPLKDSDYNRIVTSISEKLHPSLSSTCNERGYMENVVIIKIGGSILDLFNPELLRNLLKAIVKAHESGFYTMLIPGGGPLLGDLKNYVSKMGYSPMEAYKKFAEANLLLQTKMIETLMEKIKPGVSAYIPPDKIEFMLEMKFINQQYLRDRIPLFSSVPGINTGGLSIPAVPSQQSDIPLVYFADALHVKKIIFAKDTNGIYLRDPKMTEEFAAANLGEQFRHNKFFDYIRAADIQNTINRGGLEQKGDLTEEHLIETGAIQPFIDSDWLYTIQIVNGTKPDMVLKALEGCKSGSYIIKGHHTIKSSPMVK